MIRLFRVFVPVGALALLFSEILLITSCFLAVTFAMLQVDPAVFLLDDRGILRIAVVLGSILFGLFFEDLYEHIYVKSRVLLLQQLSLVMGIALVIQGIISYIDDGFRLPLMVMVPASGVLIVALYGWRVVYSALVLRVVGAHRILFVGASPLIREMARHIAAHPEIGMCVAGYVDDGGPHADGERNVLGPLRALPEVAAAVKPDRIVVGFADRRRQMPIPALLRLRYAGLAIEEAASAYEQLCGRVLLSELRPAQVVLSGAFRPRSEGKVFQTSLNWLAALILTVVSAPVLLAAVALLKLSSHGPALQRKVCLGLRGQTFPMFTLRTDPRGGAQSFVRRWRLDALPQLWNVLRGEMAFVGPRAERPEFAAALSAAIPFYRQRYRVKPGLTGWAQINTPPDDPEDTLRRLEYDFYYLKNASRGLDTYILVHTVKRILLGEAAR